MNSEKFLVLETSRSSRSNTSCVNIMLVIANETPGEGSAKLHSPLEIRGNKESEPFAHYFLQLLFLVDSLHLPLVYCAKPH